MALSDAQRLLRRSKDSERDLARFLMKNDGPDPRMTGIASSTGRVGHITNMQVDVLSRSFAAENKHVIVGKKLLQWWKQINDVAVTHKKDALLRIHPSNDLLGKKVPDLYVITGERLAELLEAERWLNLYGAVIDDMPVDLVDMLEGDDLEEYQRLRKG